MTNKGIFIKKLVCVLMEGLKLIQIGTVAEVNQNIQRRAIYFPLAIYLAELKHSKGRKQYQNFGI